MIGFVFWLNSEDLTRPIEDLNFSSGFLKDAYKVTEEKKYQVTNKKVLRSWLNRLKLKPLHPIAPSFPTNCKCSSHGLVNL